MLCSFISGKMFWEDPVLAWKCYFGSFLPYQYRLVGPNTWDGARHAIMTVWDRTLAATSTKGKMSKMNDSTPMIVYAVSAIILFAFIRWVIGAMF